MKKLITTIMALWCLTSTTMADSNTVTLHFVETSDVHGAFFPYDFIERRPMRGTMVRVSTYVNKLRSQGAEVTEDLIRANPRATTPTT